MPESSPKADLVLDVAGNRRAQKYTGGDMVLRLLWGLGKILFRFSPRPCFGWRRLLLRGFGASVGKHVHVYPSTQIYFPWNLSIGDWSAIGEGALIYNLGPVVIGQKVTISHRAHICAGTHDYTRRDLPLLKLPITLADQVWVCADAFVGPGVTIGEGAVLGARAVAIKDVEAWSIVVGNPARLAKMREIKLQS